MSQIQNQNMSKNEKQKSLTKTLVSVGASVLVLFATVWVIGIAWKKSQN
jgi:hypothetical protein